VTEDGPDFTIERSAVWAGQVRDVVTELSLFAEFGSVTSLETYAIFSACHDEHGLVSDTAWKVTAMSGVD
jgi:hypothetical protein